MAKSESTPSTSTEKPTRPRTKYAQLRVREHSAVDIVDCANGLQVFKGQPQRVPLDKARGAAAQHAGVLEIVTED